MPNDRFGFARIVIAVVKEKDDFAADLLLKTAGGLEFGEKKSLGKNPAGLLAETDDGSSIHSDVGSCSGCEVIGAAVLACALSIN